MSLKRPTPNLLVPGSHICLLYASENEHKAAVTAFFEQATAAGARVFYACSSHTPAELQARLLADNVNLQPLIERGQVTLIDTRSSMDGKLNASQLRVELLEQALQDGYPLVYMSNEMHWAAARRQETLLPAYEMVTSADTGALPLVFLCQYDRRVFSAEVLVDALVSHPLVMVGGEIYDNHLYVSPATLQNESPGETRFDFLLNQLLDHQRVENRLRRTEQLYETIATASPDGIFLLTPDAYIRFASDKALALFGYQRLEQIFGRPFWDLLAPEDLPRASTQLQNKSPEAAVGDNLYTMVRSDQSRFVAELDLSPFWNQSGEPEGSVGIIRDVSRRVELEANLHAHQARLDLVLSQIPVSIWTTDTALTITSLLGDDPAPAPTNQQPMAGRNLFDLGEQVTPAIIDAHHAALRGEPQDLQASLWGKTYTMRMQPLRDDAGQIIGVVGAGLDISDQIAAQEALYNSDQSAVALLDALSDIAILIDLDGKVLAINRPGAQELHAEPDEILGKDLFSMLSPVSARPAKRGLERLRQGDLVYREAFPLQNRYLDLAIQPVHDAHGSFVRAAMVFRDVTSFIQAETSERERRQVAENLRATSELLTQAFSADDVYTTIIESIQKLIPNVLAYLLLNEPVGSNRLRFFPQALIDALQLGGQVPLLTINNSSALRQILETHTPLVISDVFDHPGWINTENPAWTRSFAGIPIIIDSQLTAFLCLHSDQVDFFQASHLQVLENFTGQAAIALQKARAFTALQEKNVEIRAAYLELAQKNQALAVAYQATIEGWSRALELRDKETQGHSQRVVSLTVDLAKRLGISETELIYIRWGALLHDIGKMGIPDAILLKPAPLTDEDWVTMKKHPDLAFKWLSGIDYLKPALDIPQYHHESWNGGGYPLGLRGNDIPLAARIFAVIDNWDALLADRPYRPAWPRHDVEDYLRAQAGQKFDPDIVETFLEMVHE